MSDVNWTVGDPAYGYVETMNQEQRVGAEEAIAALIFDRHQGEEISESAAADLGRDVLRLVLERYRPDLFGGMLSVPMTLRQYLVGGIPASEVPVHATVEICDEFVAVSLDSPEDTPMGRMLIEWAPFGARERNVVQAQLWDALDERNERNPSSTFVFADQKQVEAPHADPIR